MKLILVFDANCHLHCDYHASPADATRNFVGRIADAVAAYAPDHVVAAFDTGRSFRYELLPEYKASRKEKEADLIHQIDMCRELLLTTGVAVEGVPGFEADDILATVCSTAREAKVVLCTADKDAFQLLEDGRVTAARKMRVEGLGADRRMTVDWMTAATLAAHQKWGITPQQMIDYQCLVGDASDNIPHPSGIGAVTARQLLTKWGTLDKAVEMLDFTPIGDKARNSIKEFVDKFPLVRNLVTLRRDVPLQMAPGGRHKKAFDDICRRERLSWYGNKTDVLLSRDFSLSI